MMTKAIQSPAFPYLGLPIIVAGILFLRAGSTDAFITLLLLLVAVFGYIASVTDIKAKKIPNKLIISMMASWIVIMLPKIFWDTDAAIAIAADSALGFVIGGGLFLLVYIISRKGLGGGDVKLVAAIGLYLGYGGVLSVMLVGTILGSLFSLTLIMAKKIGRKDAIPLAPFLYIGLLFVCFVVA
ncbi:MAG: prepilin peptidase [Oscillospiraceae bacterium]|nr:prepilin peptidase [Oscillospiraceae bacterium]